MIKERYLNKKGNYSFTFFVFDNELYELNHNQLLSFEKENDTLSIIGLAKKMLLSINNDYQFTKDDNQFKEFYKSMNNGNIEKYIDLYFELTLSRLQSITNGDFSLNKNQNQFENYMYFRDAYLRMKSSFFFNKSWFIPERFYASNGFSACFIEDEIHNKLFDIYNGMIKFDSEKYYLNAELDIYTAQKILETFLNVELERKYLRINDVFFLKALEGTVTKKVKILYVLGDER